MITADDLQAELADSVSFEATKQGIKPHVTGRQRDDLADGYEAAWRASYPLGTLQRDFTTYKRRLAALGYDLRVFGHDMKDGVEFLSFEVE